MPSQSQVKWAQLRVGITVVLAGAVLAILIFLMTGSGGLFTSKVTIRAYFDDAQGLRSGAPVNLQGVPVGNVSDIRIVKHGITPVLVRMKITKEAAQEIPVDSTAALTQAGVLGETFVNIDRTRAKSAQTLQENAELKIEETPGIQDVVKSTQTSLQNVDVLVRRLDRIVTFIESGEGSIGKLIYDKELYSRLNSTLNEVQGIVNRVSSGQGSIGKLVASDELYNKANASVDKLNNIIDEIQAGHGTVGKLLKDPSLYDNANQTISKANNLMTDINNGKGALGKFAKDEQFAAKLDNTLTKLSNIMTSLEAGEGAAGKLLKDPSLYTNADQMMVETRTLIKAVRENPKKYLTIRFKLF
ncbi:MAG TPA: MlaD family protein [Terriglobales bacterium]|nr:MlaD family protein [Terriglobales bacterium]